eukprot:jgi/Mesvir1/15826/Mv03379-RA.1
MLVVLRQAWAGQQPLAGATGTGTSSHMEPALPAGGDYHLSNLHWLSLLNLSSGQGSPQQTTQQRPRAEQEQDRRAVRLELKAKHEKELKVMKEELAAVKQKLMQEELARSKLELELVNCKAQGVAKKQDKAAEKWLERRRRSGCSNQGSGSTPLHMAAQVGRVDVIKHLAQFGMDMNSLDKNYSTPLILAIEHGKLDAVKLLIEAGAQVNVNKQQRSPYSHPWQTFYSYWPALHIAAAKGFAEIVEALLAAGAHVNEAASIHMEVGGETALHVATNKNVVKALLRAPGVVVDAVRTFHRTRYRPDSEDTPLLLVLTANRQDVATLLFEAGAKILAKGCATPTATQTIVRNEALVQEMLKKERDVYFLAGCLYVAAEHGLMPAVDAQLRAGVKGQVEREYHDNMRNIDYHNDTALFRAIQVKSLAVVEGLLKAGANPNAVRRGKRPHDAGWTCAEPALYAAVYSGSVEIVKCLVGRGAWVQSCYTEQPGG